VSILVDTSAFYILLDHDDPHHKRAQKGLNGLRAGNTPLTTHEYVVVETIALVQKRLGIAAVRRFVDDLLPLIELIWVDPELHLEAREAMLSAGRRGVSLVDWTSFLVMRRRGITTAFAFDADFATQGFGVIPASPTPSNLG